MEKYQGIVSYCYNSNGDTSTKKTKCYPTKEEANIAAEELARKNKGFVIGVVPKN